MAKIKRQLTPTLKNGAHASSTVPTLTHSGTQILNFLLTRRNFTMPNQNLEGTYSTRARLTSYRLMMTSDRTETNRATSFKRLPTSGARKDMSQWHMIVPSLRQDSLTRKHLEMEEELRLETWGSGGAMLKIKKWRCLRNKFRTIRRNSHLDSGIRRRQMLHMGRIMTQIPMQHAQSPASAAGLSRNFSKY